MKVRNLKTRMNRFTEVVAGLKEGKQEMSKQIQGLEAAIDALMVKIKVGEMDKFDINVKLAPYVLYSNTGVIKSLNSSWSFGGISLLCCLLWQARTYEECCLKNRISTVLTKVPPTLNKWWTAWN